MTFGMTAEAMEVKVFEYRECRAFFAIERGAYRFLSVEWKSAKRAEENQLDQLELFDDGEDVEKGV